MNTKWKVLILTGVLVFISGFVISYKHFQLTSEYRLRLQEQKSNEVSTWIGELLLQKVNVLESSVSNLDASTTETLKRLGVEYFAYAHKNSKDQWKVKWKTLGAMETGAIKKQVAELDFSNLSVSKREWMRLGSSITLISPVENAESSKMKSGFLVFSMSADRFEKLGALSSEIGLFSKGGDSLGSQDLSWLKAKALFGRDKTSASLLVDKRENTYLRSAVFSAGLQLWVVHFQPFPKTSFLTSASARTFFLSFLILGLFGALLTYKFPILAFGASRRRGSQWVEGKASSPLLSVVLHRMRNDLNRLRSDLGEMDEPLRKMDIIESVDRTKNWLGATDTKMFRDVRDFGKCIDVITQLKQGEMAKAGISLQTQIEDDAAVICPIDAVEEFLIRLLDNSIATLAGASEKWIHMECTRVGDFYQFIYRDSRNSQLPRLTDESQLLTAENPFEDINGILAFGHFAFGEDLQTAETELNVTLRLPADGATTTILPPLPSELTAAKDSIEKTPVSPSVVADVGESGVYNIELDSEYELEDIETLQILSAGTEEPAQGKNSIEPISVVIPSIPLEIPAAGASTLSEEALPQVSQGDIEDMVKDFELKELNFDETLPAKPSLTETEILGDSLDEPKVFGVSEGPQGLVEFNAGDLKLKIRSPKKRNSNVSG